MKLLADDKRGWVAPLFISQDIPASKEVATLSFESWRTLVSGQNFLKQVNSEDNIQFVRNKEKF